MRRVAVALLHHPVLGRDGQVLTTTITNLDLHDMARAVRVYGLAALYAVHPLASQRELALRVQRHWVSGAGGRRIPDRIEALAMLRVVADLPEARKDLDPSGARVQLWTTAASARGAEATCFDDARRVLDTDGPAVLLCFGTGWGLAPELLDAADVRLEPIVARRDTAYNHLSVRAACAITLDRLFG